MENQMGLAELLLSACLFFVGAIIEHDSKGAITQNIYYSDSNISECKK